MELGRRGFWALAAALLLPGVVCLVAPGAVRGWVAGGAPDEAGVLLHDHPEGAPAHAVARAYAQHAAQSRRFETALVFLIGLLYLGLASRWLAGRAAAEDRRRRDAAFAMHLQTLLDGIRRVESTTNPDALPPLLEMLSAARRRAESDWQRGRLTADDLTRLYAVYQASAWPAARRHNRLLHEELLARGEAPGPGPAVAAGEPPVAEVKPAPVPVVPAAPAARVEAEATKPVPETPAAAVPPPAPRVLPAAPRAGRATPVSKPAASPSPPPRPVPAEPVAIATPPPVVQRPPMRAEHISEGIIGEPVVRSRRAEPEREETAAAPSPAAAGQEPEPRPEPAPEAGSERRNAPPPRPAAQTAPRKKGKQRLRKKQEKTRRSAPGPAPDNDGNSGAEEQNPAQEANRREPGQMGFDF